MHSYYAVRRPVVEQFMALPNEENWLLIRRNKIYLAVPKKITDVDIRQLDATQTALEKEGQEALALGKQFLALIDGLRFPRRLPTSLPKEA
jgi:hypothetical protein